MNRSRVRFAQVFSCVVLAAVVSAAAACVGSEDNVGPAAQTQEDSGAQPVTPGPVEDSGTPSNEEGEEVAEDGDLPEIVPDDASTEEVGPDGGIIVPGCLVVPPGPYVESTCSSRLVTFTSVGLVSGTYHLKSVRVLGNANFCSNTFKPFEHGGSLVVKAASAASGSMSFYDRFRTKGGLATAVNRHTADVVVTETTVTFGTPTCAAGQAAPESAQFGSGTANGKKFVQLRLPYGASGQAIYRFEEP